MESGLRIRDGLGTRDSPLRFCQLRLEKLTDHVHGEHILDVLNFRIRGKLVDVGMRHLFTEFGDPGFRHDRVLRLFTTSVVTI